MPLSLPPPPGTQPISITEDSTGKPCKVRTDNFWTDWFNRLQILLNTLIPAGGAQAAIQFQDEGSNLGASGTVDAFNFVGANLTVTRVGNLVTVTENAQAPIQFKDEGIDLGTSGTANSFNVVGSATLTRVGTALTLTVSGGQAAVQYQDEGIDLGTPGTVDTVDFVGENILASRAGNTLTVTALSDIFVGSITGLDSTLTIFGRDGIGIEDGGAVLIAGGFSGTGATGNGGNVYINSADSLATDGNGGFIQIAAGSGTGTGNPGSINAQAGNSPLYGGEVQFTGGNAAAGLGGDIVFQPGVGTTGDGDFYLNFQPTSTLQISGDPGIAGQVFTSSGPSVNPVWSTISAAGIGAQVGIQFQDEGADLGTSGTVTTVNIIGPNVIVARVGDVLTVTERASSRAYAARH